MIPDVAVLRRTFFEEAFRYNFIEYGAFRTGNEFFFREIPSGHAVTHIGFLPHCTEVGTDDDFTEVVAEYIFSGFIGNFCDAVGEIGSIIVGFKDCFAFLCRRNCFFGCFEGAGG